MRTITVGDIHGCYYTLMTLLDKINYDPQQDRLIITGDVIDRGRNSYELFNFIINTRIIAKSDKFIWLLGNHEQMFLDYVNEVDKSWISNGGNKTKRSFYKNGQSYKAMYHTIKSLPLYFKDGDIVWCHSSLSKPDIEENTKDDILWSRNVDSKRKCLTMHGHTTVEDNLVNIKYNCICIDNGCVFGGRLCAIIMDDNEISSIRFEYKNKDERD